MAEPGLESEFLQAPSSPLFVLHLWGGGRGEKEGREQQNDNIESAESNKGHKQGYKGGLGSSGFP